MPFMPSRESQMTEEQLKWGYWWVTHKLLLKRLLTVAIALVAAVLVIFAGYGFVDWFFGSGVQERAAIAQMANQPTGYPAIQQASMPTQIAIDNPTVLVSGSGAYDIVSLIRNDNTDWWAELTWHFTADGQPVGRSRRSTVLPSNRTYLVHLGLKSDSRPSGVDLVIDELNWHRLDKHMARPDYASWAGQRLDFRIADVSFSPPAPDDLLQVSRATFKVTNGTGYGYWKVGFFVTLWDGQTMVGVNYVTASEMLAESTRTVDASWFTGLPRVSRVEVTPDLNIFDQANYMPVRN